MLNYPPECMYPCLASTLKFYWGDTLVNYIYHTKKIQMLKKKKNFLNFPEGQHGLVLFIWFLNLVV